MTAGSTFSTLSRLGSSFSTAWFCRDLPSPCNFNALRALYVPEHLACAMLLCKREGYMFKISTIDTVQERRLVVEGTLVQPWVAELRKSWNSAAESLEGRKLVIDLTNATKIDPEGEAAIFELMKEGAKFSCSGVLTKHVLQQLASRCHCHLREVLTRQRSRE